MSPPVTRRSIAPIGPVDAMWLRVYFWTHKNLRRESAGEDWPPGRYDEEIEAGNAVARRALDEYRSRQWWRRWARPRPPLPEEFSRAEWQHHREAFLKTVLLIVEGDLGR
jgi:hypothetical protein